MATASREAPADQGVTFVELFFDLVFVFAVTEVTGLLHHDLTAGGVARFVLVFWLVWWAWTQYTWALNSADTHHGVQAAVLASVVLAFAMAIGVGRAYEGSGLWFALRRPAGAWPGGSTCGSRSDTPSGGGPWSASRPSRVWGWSPPSPAGSPRRRCAPGSGG